MNNEILILINKEIKNCDNIVILSHLRPDFDSIGSGFALKKSIKTTYPTKNVLYVNEKIEYFNFFGIVDTILEDDIKDSLIICLDVANSERISSPLWNKGSKVIKIDHHPDNDSFGDLNFVDTNISCTSEIIFNFLSEFNYNIDKNIAELIYFGILGDTGRFYFRNTTPDTFLTVSKLFNYGIDPINDLYPYIYKTSYNQILMRSKLLDKLNIDNGFGFLLLDIDYINSFEERNIDMSLITNFIGIIKEVKIWLVIKEEEKNKFKCSIRSKNIVINKIAEKYNGGGHPLASGILLENKIDIELLKSDLVKEINND